MAGFRGINPPHLVRLADTADGYGRQLAATRRSTSRLLRRRSISDAAHVDRLLAEIERKLSRRAQELRWRAFVMVRTQGVSTEGPGFELTLGRFAESVIFDLETWQIDFEYWRLGAIVAHLEGLAPRDRPGAISKLGAADRAALATEYPEEIGAMDGAPAQLRYAANRTLIQREIDYLEGWVEQWRGNDSRVLRLLVDALDTRLTEYRRWLVEHRQILLFDPTDDGRVVEVFGDLDSATRIAVVVPGMANSIDNFSEGDGGFRRNAADLYEATGGTGVATIAWLGYDTPDNIGAVSRSAANRGAPRLRAFLEGIDPGADRAITVIAHSYGSVLAGIAARDGIETNDLVFVGSPGTTLERAGDAVLRDGGRVWVALAEKDPIALGAEPSEVPWWLPPPLWPAWIGGDLWNDGAAELWHGPNPAGDDFGALRIATDGSTGHSDYFAAGSLENLVRIVRGRYAEVELVD